LRTQRGVAYETGIETNQRTYHAKFGVYLLHLKDEITFDPLQTPQYPFGTNTNLDPTQRKGATLSGKYHINKNVTLDGQYNVVNARFQSGINKNKRIPLVSENIIRAGINWNLMQYWHMYFDAVFTGSQFAANDDANITSKLGGYTVYNFNLRYDYKQVSAALHINNIFNRNYFFYSVYQPGMPSNFFYPAPDRNFTLTLNYLFS
jgi:outer membrane receptor for ferrienterochelin and colicin